MSLTRSQIDQLLKLGVEIDALTFPNDPMWEAVHKVVQMPELVANLSIALKMNLREHLEALDAHLQTVEHVNEFPKVIVVCTLFGVIAVLSVALRIYSRQTVTKRLWPEDYWSAAGGILSIGMTTMFIFSTKWVCRHLWDMTFNDMKEWLFWLLVAEVTFAVTLVPVKFSFAVFYYRLIPDAWYRRSIIAIMVSIVAISISGILLFFFQCEKVDYWNHLLDPEFKCINREAIYPVWGAFTIASDIILLLLPIWKISKLSLRNKKEKIYVINMFAAGGLVCVANVMRVIYFNYAFTKVDNTYALIPVDYWGVLEIDLAIVISCLPAIRHLLVEKSSGGLSNLASKIIRSIRPKKKSHNPESLGAVTVTVDISPKDSGTDASKENLHDHSFTPKGSRGGRGRLYSLASFFTTTSSRSEEGDKTPISKVTRSTLSYKDSSVVETELHRMESDV